MDEMIGKLQGVSLAREDEVTSIEDDWIQEGKYEVQFNLLEKILTTKPVGLNFFKDLSAASRLYPRGSLDITLLGPNTFFFNFNQESDKLKVLRN